MAALSWNGSRALKDDVLAQMDAHHAVPRLDPIIVDGREVVLYDWPKPADTAALRDALHIPVDLLSVGSWLWDGFPEGDDGVREVIAERRKFLAAVPVGVDLSSVATELMVFCFMDESWGVVSTIDDPAAIALVEQTALGLVTRNVADTEARVRVALDAWAAEIPRLWQSERRVDSRVYEHVRALHAAFTACRTVTARCEAGLVLDAAVYGHGVNVQHSDEKEEALRTALVRLLSEL